MKTDVCDLFKFWLEKKSFEGFSNLSLDGLDDRAKALVAASAIGGGAIGGLGGFLSKGKDGEVSAERGLENLGIGAGVGGTGYLVGDSINKKKISELQRENMAGLITGRKAYEDKMKKVGPQQAEDFFSNLIKYYDNKFTGDIASLKKKNLIASLGLGGVGALLADRMRD